MRTEQEVRQMIAELKEIEHPQGQGTAQAVIAALDNVLTGPQLSGRCACLGPAGCCRCMMRRLAMPETAA